MCLIFIAFLADKRYPLVVAANRDEYHDRPSADLGYWDDAPHVLAGRDLRAGGTWFGVTRAGRFAAVTNFREPGRTAPRNAPSRGSMVRDFLTGDTPAAAFVEALRPRRHRFPGFNLLVGDPGQVHYCSNRGEGNRTLEPGIHGLSNHLLNTPWPKVEAGRTAVAALLGQAHPDPLPPLLHLLADTSTAPDALLPDTGIGLAKERVLSSRFILGEAYGTRCSTVLCLDARGLVRMRERRYGRDGAAIGEVSFQFPLPTP